MKMQKLAIAVLLSAGLASLCGCGKDDVKPTPVKQVQHVQKVSDGAETPPILPPPPHH
jgi:hypothetical protein